MSYFFSIKVADLKKKILFFLFLCAGSYTPLQAVQIHIREGNSNVCILQEVGLFQVNYFLTIG